MKKKAIIVLVLFFSLVISLVSNEIPSYAAAWQKMPAGTPIPTSQQQIPLSLNTVTEITYNDTAYPGLFKTITYDNGYLGLCVKIGNTSKSYSYKNYCTAVFAEAATIRGRSIDVKVDFVSLDIAALTATSALASDGYMAFAYLNPWAIQISNTSNRTNKDDGLRRGYNVEKDVGMRVTVTWSDSGEIVDLPFYQGINDIDAAGSYYTEGWTGGIGFAGTFYIWPECIGKYSGTTIKADPNADSTSGNDSWYKTGVVAPTAGGQWDMTFYEGNCSTGCLVYSQYLDLEPPKKAVKKEILLEGDQVTWTVSQEIGTFYTDMYSPYSQFGFSDTLPDGVKYISAKVWNGENEITDQGSLEYQEDTKKLTFTLNESLLSQTSFYQGQTITLEITAEVEDSEVAGKALENTAATVISGFSQDTNTAVATVYKPSLEVTKTAGSLDYYVTDQGGYTVTVTQTTPYCTAKKVIIEDAFVVEGVEINPESVKVWKGQEEITKEATLTLTGNGAGYRLETNTDLAYGETLTVTYEAAYQSDDLANQGVNNKISATCENGLPGTSECVVNLSFGPAELTIKKESGKSRYGIGDNVEYTLTVESMGPYDAKQVVIQDVLGQLGVTIQEDTLKVLDADGQEITGDCRVNIEDGTVTIETGKTLPIGETLTVTYSVSTGQDFAGETLDSIVTTYGINAPQVKDTNQIEIVYPVLEVKKEASKGKYYVEDTGTYIVTIHQTDPDATAKNVEIEDLFDREGIQINPESVKVWKGQEEITGKCTLSLVGSGAGYRMKTGSDLAYGETLTVTYEAVYGSDDLVGQKLTNKVSAFEDYGGEADAEAVVSLERGPAELSVEKSADKGEYAPGDTIHYTVTVRSTGDYTAKQVRITNWILTEGIEILKDSIQIFDPGGQEITGECKVRIDGREIRIETKKDLSPGESMVVTYRAEVGKEFPGGPIESRVSAASENADPQTENCNVLVQTSKETTKVEDNVTSSPKTGDSEGGLGVYILAIILSTEALFLAIKFRKNKNL